MMWELFQCKHMHVQAIVIPFDRVNNFKKGELSRPDDKMDLLTMSKKKTMPLYEVGINPKNPLNAQPLYLIQYYR